MSVLRNPAPTVCGVTDVVGKDPALDMAWEGIEPSTSGLKEGHPTLFRSKRLKKSGNHLIFCNHTVCNLRGV